MSQTAEQFLEQNTEYCSKLRARITPQQCQHNRKLANQGSKPYALEDPSIQLKHCQNCPGLDELNREPGEDERRCGLCKQIKSLDRYRPYVNQTHLPDPQRVKTCLDCEERYGWLPADYQRPVNDSPTIPTEGNHDSEEVSAEKEQQSQEEWEENTQEGEKMKEECPTTNDSHPPTNDPLANAKPIAMAYRAHQEPTTPVATLHRAKKSLTIHFGMSVTRAFPQITEYSFLDFFEDEDGHVLILLNNSPDGARRLINDASRKTRCAYKTCVTLIARAMGWEIGQKWHVEATSRKDVLRLVKVE